MRNLIAFFLLTAISIAAFADSAEPSPIWLFSFAPELTVPLYPGREYFSMSGGGRIGMEYRPIKMPGFAINGGLSYAFGALPEEVGTTSQAMLLGGAAWRFPLGKGFRAGPAVSAGIGFGFLNADGPAGGGFDPVLQAGGGISWDLARSLSLRLDASYLYHIGLFGGLNLSLGLAYGLQPPQTKTGSLEVTDVLLQSVFPIFHAYYDDHSLGMAVVENTGKDPIRDLRVSFLIRQYMDAAKECGTVDELKPGEKLEIPLFAVFAGAILTATEATKAAAEVSVTYREGSGSFSAAKTATVRVYDRNAMTWDDDRKAAAFVSAKDPSVLAISHAAAAAVKKAGNPGIPAQLQTAIALHSALRLLGLSYVSNPATPYSQSSKNPEIVDYLKFPRQTLTFKSGDCSDLSILYASLFESVGIPTAFITVPGHIFMAIGLELGAAEAAERILDAQSLIIRDGRAWLPIETTVRDKGLIAAWKEGWRSWQQGVSEKNGAFYPIREAWELFEPVGLPADGTVAAVPDEERIAKMFSDELQILVDAELGERLARANEAIRRSGETAKNLNGRGVAYARYGKLDLADSDFRAALAKQPDYWPAILNRANIEDARKNLKAALDLYRLAGSLSKDDARIQIKIAVTANALGMAQEAQAAYLRARDLDPAKAAGYEFLDRGGASATRESNGDPETVWETEEER